MKKWNVMILALAMLLVLAACGTDTEKESTGSDAGAKDGAASETVTLRVGASPQPHSQILEHVKPVLEQEGIQLEIIEFTDYVQPNQQTDQKEIDANFFQHKPYLDGEIEQRGFDLAPVTAVHVEPMGAYSNQVESLDDLKDGAVIAIPNDPSNGGRALLLLAKHGVIQLEDDSNLAVTAKDITGNPKNLEFKEVDAAMLPRMLDEMDAAVINTNYALEAGLNPLEDALVIEDKDNPYANLLVARSDNKDSEAIQKLAEALTSAEMKTFIEEQFKGSIIPAF
ncbi:MetQ/NlpA family ABC transporter substrate-binding protein [Paenibacillus sp. F411]|uniref:MetQ/NlpA family ABC transporter substrate-binding protein n=1 Tax=unclassified Paenibacillus TaxID=185978 RepID=UPI001AAE8E74|nr:MetQ/NlpA family ABC transporter substrate-binding protein [Paenibacillus sp. F411]MBO2943877.1 MetQ/NlpA family ABC transporter substrate-binding protein [Paenibacillus sp. F411]